ncbi:hypothetical protein V7149_00365 [Bacillus sp. JJ1503]|uniref:hypothetical protein n=1 Tax=Bacillus sp. JJ1503 TaxID=3122956 RepID=UPI0030006DD1
MIVADELIVKQITQPPKIDKHAKQRAEERYGMTPDELNKYLGKHFREFEFVTVTYGYGGKPSRMFVHEGKTFIFRMYDNYLQTTFPANGVKSGTITKRLAKKFAGLYNEELRKFERWEARKIRELVRFQAELERELSDIRYRLTTVRSLAKKIAYRARIVAIELRIADIPEEIAKVHIEKMRKVQALVHISKGAV